MERAISVICCYTNDTHLTLALSDTARSTTRDAHMEAPRIHHAPSVGQTCPRMSPSYETTDCTRRSLERRAGVSHPSRHQFAWGTCTGRLARDTFVHVHAHKQTCEAEPLGWSDTETHCTCPCPCVASCTLPHCRAQLFLPPSPEQTVSPHSRRPYSNPSPHSPWGKTAPSGGKSISNSRVSGAHARTGLTARVLLFFPVERSSTSASRQTPTRYGDLRSHLRSHLR
jgi:hypothetical protein